MFLPSTITYIHGISTGGRTGLRSIPDYLRTTTNRCKNLIAERVVLDYLTKEGFLCEIYLTVAEWRKTEWKEDIEYYRRRYEGDLEKYSSKIPPENWQYPFAPIMTWDEYRKVELRHVKTLINGIEHAYPIDVEEEEEFERVWGPHLGQIKRYNKWLKARGDYRPDYVAKSGDTVYLVEVKSSLSERTPLLGERQKKALLKAYDFEMKPMLLTVSVSIDIEIGEPQLKAVER
jgi:hypothetical protein